MKTEQEIEEMCNVATDAVGSLKYPGMTYEEGVQAALDWVLGRFPDDEPIL